MAIPKVKFGHHWVFLFSYLIKQKIFHFQMSVPLPLCFRTNVIAMEKIVRREKAALGQVIS